MDAENGHVDTVGAGRLGQIEEVELTSIAHRA